MMTKQEMVQITFPHSRCQNNLMVIMTQIAAVMKAGRDLRAEDFLEENREVNRLFEMGVFH